MATGIELVISSICNITFCEPIYDNPLKVNAPMKKQLELKKLANELNGKHIKVATYNNSPTSWTTENEDGSLTGHGVAFSIMEILQKKFNFTFEVVVPKRNVEVGGARPEESLIGLLNSSAVDMAAVFLPSILTYRGKLDFSLDLDVAPWRMMMKRPKQSATGFGILAPFDIHVWYCILATLIFIAPCLTLITKLRSMMISDGENHIPLPASAWFIYSSFFKQGSLESNTNTARVLISTWWLFVILLSSYYTANLTAFLTLSEFTLDIKNTGDLYLKHYRWISNSGGALQLRMYEAALMYPYLRDMLSSERSKYVYVTDTRELLPRVLGGAVLVKEKLAIDHLMYEEYLINTRKGLDEAEMCTYVVAPTATMSLPRGFAYPQGSGLMKLFDPVLSHLIQAGIIDVLLTRDLPSTEICPIDLKSKDRKLKSSDLLATYFLLGAGLAAGGAIFIAEFFIRDNKIGFNEATSLNEPQIKDEQNVQRIRFKESDEKAPPPPYYEALFHRYSRYKNTKNVKTKIVNGREYCVVKTVSGDTRLIPMRTPSALLFQEQ